MSVLLTMLQQHPLFLGVLLFVVGLLVGSFLNVVIHRLPAMLQHQWESQCRELLPDDHNEPQPPPNLIKPGSHCPTCRTPLRPWHNIPLLSYLLQRGRCAFCNTPISRRYPVVELFTGLLALHAGLHFGLTPQLLAASVLGCSLIALSVIDLDHQLLPDNITLPLLWAGLLANLFELFAPLVSAVIGAMAGYLVLWSIYQLHHLLTGKEGMGYGDFKLLAALGAWLGWQKLPLILLLAAVCGTLVALYMIVRRGHGRDVPIPFGPYLALAGWIAMLWGEQLVAGYLQFTGLRL